MMFEELHKLVHSLSSVEKKMFNLYTNVVSDEKDYLYLYDLILNGKERNRESIQQLFNTSFPKKSFQNNMSYLYKTLIRVLVMLRIDQDEWYNQLYRLMTARLCIERSIPEYGLKELSHAKHSAIKQQNHIVAYHAERMELSLLSNLDFPNMDEDALIGIQMGLKTSLAKIKQIQEQFSLYELLNLRTINQVLISTPSNNKNIQDLIFSELSLISGKNKNMFSAQKLHLLFQSFFFIHISDYKSALRVFKSLNEQFESNEDKWDFPPYDYLSALDGILDSLRTIKKYDEMLFYIEKLSSLYTRSYPEHFRNEIIKNSQVYSLHRLVGLRKLNEALAITSQNNFSTGFQTTSDTKDLELLLLTCSLHCQLDKWASVRRLASAFLHHKSKNPLQRAGKLLYIVSCYETDDMGSLSYEIRSYKRAIGKGERLLTIEKIIFSIISIDIKRRGKLFRLKTWKKIQPRIQFIIKDKNEISLLKHYNFVEWVSHQLSASDLHSMAVPNQN